MTPINFGLKPISERAARPSSGFSPSDIVDLWLDYSDISTQYKDSAISDPVTATGDVIGATTDKTVNGWDATQPVTSEKAIYRTGVQNSLSAGEYSSSWYDFNNPSNSIIPSTTDWCFYFSFGTGSNVTTAQAVFAQYIGDSGNGRFIIRIIGGKIVLFLGDDGVQATVASSVSYSISINTKYIASLRRDGNSYIIRANGADVAQYNDTGTRQLLQSGSILGGRTVDTPYNEQITDKMNLDLFEVFYQDGLPTTENLENMDTYSNGKWAVY